LQGREGKSAVEFGAAEVRLGINLKPYSGTAHKSKMFLVDLPASPEGLLPLQTHLCSAGKGTGQHLALHQSAAWGRGRGRSSQVHTQNAGRYTQNSRTWRVSTLPV